MSPSEAEYVALRRTIASRGTVRIALVPAVILGWALVAVGPSGARDTLVALAVLAAGFEAVHALHVGVERIGRYLQVFYENGSDGPRWETTVMGVGPALPGGGIDPLFAVLFGAAVVLNGLPPLLRPTDLWALVSLLAHVLVLVRIVRARQAAARQRAVELESYRALRARAQSQDTAS